MTWYASQILANRAALTELQRDPFLSKGLYLIPQSEPLDGLSLSGDLLVAREVTFEAETHESKWYSEASLPWHSESPEAPSEIVSQILGNASDCLEDSESEILPAQFLELLLNIASTSSTPIVYYTAQMWGGLYDKELTFCFDNELRVHCRLEKDKIIEISPEGRTERHYSTSPIEIALQFLGHSLKSTYCKFLTRPFPWSKFALSPGPDFA